MEHRDRRGRFGPGNPGRPRGAVSGRARALAAIDRWCEGDPERFTRWVEEKWAADPAWVWVRVIQPNLPHELKADVAGTVGHDDVDGEPRGLRELARLLMDALLKLPGGREAVDEISAAVRDKMQEPYPSYPVLLQKDRFVTPPPDPGE